MLGALLFIDHSCALQLLDLLGGVTLLQFRFELAARVLGEVILGRQVVHDDVALLLRLARSVLRVRLGEQVELDRRLGLDAVPRGLPLLLALVEDAAPLDDHLGLGEDLLLLDRLLEVRIGALGRGQRVLHIRTLVMRRLFDRRGVAVRVDDRLEVVLLADFVQDRGLLEASPGEILVHDLRLLLHDTESGLRLPLAAKNLRQELLAHLSRALQLALLLKLRLRYHPLKLVHQSARFGLLRYLGRSAFMDLGLVLSRSCGVFGAHLRRECPASMLQSAAGRVESRAVVLREEGLACDSPHLGMSFGLGAALRRLGGLLTHRRL